VFRELLLGRNPVIRLVKVDRYLQPADEWQAKNDPDVRVVARLYNGDPLVVEKRFGRGRVAAVLSTYAPIWNDMVLGPNVLVTLKLQAYLAETRGQREERLVGQPLSVQLNAQKDLAQVRFVTPGRQADAPRVIQRDAKQEPNSPVMTADLVDPDSAAGETDRPGVYESWVELIGGGVSVGRQAYNVDTVESDLQTTTPQELATALDPAPFEYLSADDMGIQLAGAEGFNPSLWIMGLLILVLAVEQILAYANTYHPARGGAA
jgi:hypothetical protein